ncbi:MAG: translocation/assembly module TamB [Syntrophales bacterium]|jgi:autotransporter translocation and assembly factor TamB|nr:translocation/assembly module TamB [Syntrophales bacterium]MDY0045215.1 translocation/assembly module TamB domain-containing protein [Syntrophales bacterium]
MKKLLNVFFVGITVIIILSIISIEGVQFLFEARLGQQIIVSKINSKIAGSVAFKDLELDLLKGSVVIHEGILKDRSQKDIAGFKKLSMSISLNSLLRGHFTIPFILLDKPWADVHRNERKEINIIQSVSSHTTETKTDDHRSSRHPLIFKKIKIDDASFHFSDQEEYYVDAEGIAVTASGNFYEERAKIQCDIRRLSLNTPAVNLCTNSILVNSRYEKGTIDSLSVQLHTKASSASLSGRIERILSEPVVDLDAVASLSLPEMSNLAKLTQNSTGAADLHLKMNGSPANPTICMNLIYSGGSIASYPVDSFAAEATLNDRSITLHSMKACLAAGKLETSGSVCLKEAFPEGFFTGCFYPDNISYSLSLITCYPMEVKKLAPENLADMQGHINSSMKIAGQGIALDTAFAEMSADLSLKNFISATITNPLDISMRSDVSLDKGIVSFKNAVIESGSSTLEGSGTVDILSGPINGDITAKAQEMSEFLSYFGLPEIRGSAHLTTEIKGTLLHPNINLKGWGKAVHYNEFAIGDINISAHLDDRTLNVSSVKIKNKDSSLVLTGTIHPFEKDSLQPAKDPVFNLKIHASSSNLNNLVPKIKGKAAVDAQFAGTLQKPQGDMHVILSNVSSDFQKLEEITCNASFDGTTFWITSLLLTAAPGEIISGHGHISKDTSFGLAISSQRISLASLDAIDQKLSGNIGFSIEGKGSLHAPLFAGTAHIKDLHLKENKLNDVTLKFNYENFIIRASGRSDISFTGEYNLNSKAFAAEVSADKANLSPYFTIAGHSDLGGLISAHVTAEGNVSNIQSINAVFDIKKIDIYSAEFSPLLSGTDIEFTLHGGQISAEKSTLKLLSDGDLHIEGKSDITGSFELITEGTIPLRLAQPFLADITDISGKITFLSKISGNISDPDISAEIFIEDGGFSHSGYAQQVRSISGKISLTEKTVTVSSLTGNLDSGRFDVTGTVDLEDLKPHRANITFTGNSLPFQVPDTLSILVNTRLNLEGTMENASLTGEIIIAEGSYYRDVKLQGILKEAVLERKPSSSPQKPGKYDSLLDNIKLDIKITAQDFFMVNNNIAYLEINPDIKISGNAANPILKGRASVISGNVTYQKRTFTVTRGVIDFLNPYRTEATIDIAGKATIRDWRITLKISGTPEELAFMLDSDPHEEHIDIISLLVIGKTARELTEGKGGPSLSTEAIITKIINATMGEDIRKRTGLDTFEVETLPGENGESDERIKVTIGKELSRRMSLKYSVETEEGEMSQRAIAEYKFLENILLRGFQDNSGTFGGQIQFRLEFR